eukprot:scaffold449_cov241-Pinguiococcus_pyrenoidosus.AAC.30
MTWHRRMLWLTVKGLQIFAVEKGRLGQHDAIVAIPVGIPPAAVAIAPGLLIPRVHARAEADQAALGRLPNLHSPAEVLASDDDVIVDAENGLRGRPAAANTNDRPCEESGTAEDHETESQASPHIFNGLNLLLSRSTA